MKRRINKSSAIERFLALPEEVKNQQWNALNTPDLVQQSRALTATESRRWKRAQRGRPRVGRGAKVISLSIEQGLLRRVDVTAKRLGITRAQLVAQGLRLVMARGHATSKAG